MITKKEKNTGITLIALVITIVIMLLLAGVALQIAMGENGLIAKSVQAQKEQAKAELYETAKLSYATLNAKALENGQPSPQVELALSTTQFRDKYNIVGDDITDKNGNVIDTKTNVLNVIQGTVAGGFSSGTSTGGTSSTESWPKTVGGVTIPEEDKDKMICKLVVKKNTEVMFGASSTDPIEVDYGNGVIAELYYPEQKAYNRGEYILKFKNITDFRIGIMNINDFEIEILQWGNIKENTTLEIYSVSKIYEPEPDKILVKYINAKFTEIPEWLFSKKTTSTVMSTFTMCNNITSIPEGLFKNNLNITSFARIFYNCKGLTSIPEGLFKNNINAINFENSFTGCSGLTSIPEGLFKNNINATNFENVFVGCLGLTSVPEGLFKNNVNATNFGSIFERCTGLTSVPEGLFKNNVNVTSFKKTFEMCTGLTSIPEELFKNNVNVTSFEDTFSKCAGLTSIPENIIELGKKVKERGGISSGMFWYCISASNYSSIPGYMK